MISVGGSSLVLAIEAPDRVTLHCFWGHAPTSQAQLHLAKSAQARLIEMVRAVDPQTIAVLIVQQTRAKLYFIRISLESGCRLSTLTETPFEPSGSLLFSDPRLIKASTHSLHLPFLQTSGNVCAFRYTMDHVYVYETCLHVRYPPEINRVDDFAPLDNFFMVSTGNGTVRLFGKRIDGSYSQQETLTLDTSWPLYFTHIPESSTGKLIAFSSSDLFGLFLLEDSGNLSIRDVRKLPPAQTAVLGAVNDSVFLCRGGILFEITGALIARVNGIPHTTDCFRDSVLVLSRPRALIFVSWEEGSVLVCNLQSKTSSRTEISTFPRTQALNSTASTSASQVAILESNDTHAELLFLDAQGPTDAWTLSVRLTGQDTPAAPNGSLPVSDAHTRGRGGKQDVSREIGLAVLVLAFIPILMVVAVVVKRCVRIQSRKRMHASTDGSSASPGAEESKTAGVPTHFAVPTRLRESAGPGAEMRAGEHPSQAVLAARLPADANTDEETRCFSEPHTMDMMDDASRSTRKQSHGYVQESPPFLGELTRVVYRMNEEVMDGSQDLYPRNGKYGGDKVVLLHALEHENGADEPRSIPDSPSPIEIASMQDGQGFLHNGASESFGSSQYFTAESRNYDASLDSRGGSLSLYSVLFEGESGDLGSGRCESASLESGPSTIRPGSPHFDSVDSMSDDRYYTA